MLLRWYKSTALIALNTVLLFFFINLISWLALAIWPAPGHDLKHIYTVDHYKKAYPQYTASEIDALLGETTDRGFIYDPYQCYREAPFHGRYINVSQQGYRCNGFDRPDANDTAVIPVFLFGGSTAFGYGVADTNTIAAYLDRRMKEKDKRYCVYNFGAGGYFSAQELIWFKRTLEMKKKPVTVIFLDGLNDLTIQGDEPLFAGSIRNLLGAMELSHEPDPHYHYLSALPIVRLYFQITHPVKEKNPDPNVDPKELQYLLGRYKTNCLTENAIAGVYGIKPLFVVQPVPQYDYDLSYHIFKGDPRLSDPYVIQGYPLLHALCSDTTLSYLWLGNMQHAIKKNLYVDDVHYTPDMNRMIADSIFEKLSK